MLTLSYNGKPRVTKWQQEFSLAFKWSDDWNKSKRSSSILLSFVNKILTNFNEKRKPKVRFLYDTIHCMLFNLFFKSSKKLRFVSQFLITFWYKETSKTLKGIWNKVKAQYWWCHRSLSSVEKPSVSSDSTTSFNRPQAKNWSIKQMFMRSGIIIQMFKYK